MRLEVSLTVDARMDELFGWWTDFTEWDHVHTSVVIGTRNITSREGNVFLIEDHYSKPIDLTVRWKILIRPPDTVIVKSDNRIWCSEGEYFFKEEKGGTRVTLRTELRPKGFWRLLLSPPIGLLTSRMVRSYFIHDLQDHLTEFAKEGLLRSE
ncbi:MAG: hypothetical protein LYZ66_02130 [Nitrososphaerales archaeon]|nr:hypothetical protein [Nitrososphaerales archaeon]